MEYDEKEVMEFLKDFSKYMLSIPKENREDMLREMHGNITELTKRFVLTEPNGFTLTLADAHSVRHLNQSIFMLGFYSALRRMGVLDEYIEDIMRGKPQCKIVSDAENFLKEIRGKDGEKK